MAMANSVRKKWTIDELESLPDDGNKYELIHGELFVTPAPRPAHQALSDALAAILLPYVEAQKIGRMTFPRSVIQINDSEVEPDLMVRPKSRLWTRWQDAPIPSLVVEVLSDATHRRDRTTKRDYYLEQGIPEYWIIDGDERRITVIAANRPDIIITDTLTWSPPQASASLVVDVQAYFDDALGPSPSS